MAAGKDLAGNPKIDRGVGKAGMGLRRSGREGFKFFVVAQQSDESPHAGSVE